MGGIPGTYKISLRGHRSYTPNSLPPNLHLSIRAEREVEAATHLLGKVEMCRILLPNADLLIYGSLQREALASSTIEGTIASPEELVLYQAGQHQTREAAKEVANYAAALSWGVEQLASRPIAYNLIVGLHERLLRDVRGALGAGRLKQDQNFIGSSTTDTIKDAIFVPPPPEDTLDLIIDLERYINNPNNQEPRVVQCALTHYQFETIHPFSDGNGRVGRLLIILQMIHLGLLSAPLIYPSKYFERNRQAYYAHLQAIRDRGTWSEWVEFFARGIKEQCNETIAFTNTILQLREHLRQHVGNVSRRAAVAEVLAAFFEEPVLSIRAISDRAHMAIHSAQSAVAILEQQQFMGLPIVRELTGMQKRRVYACLPVLSAIFGSEFGNGSTAI